VAVGATEVAEEAANSTAGLMTVTVIMTVAMMMLARGVVYIEVLALRLQRLVLCMVLMRTVVVV